MREKVLGYGRFPGGRPDGGYCVRLPFAGIQQWRVACNAGMVCRVLGDIDADSNTAVWRYTLMSGHPAIR